MNIIFLFFLFSFFGWVLETVYASFIFKKYTSKKTLLTLPLCPVYGLGGIALMLTLYPVRESWLLVFCGGFFVASSVEYLVAIFYEHFFGVSWWDYGKNFGNLNGKVCIRLSLLWGIIAIFFFEFVLPWSENLISYMGEYQKALWSVLLILFFITDYRNTLKEIKKYSKGIPSGADNKFAALRRINISKL